jgi:Spy/CpxP family protein refolding chaperone
MKRKTTLKLAAALIATTMIATPFAASYASPGEREHKGEYMRGEHGEYGEHGKHYKGGMFHGEGRERVVPLTVDEARTLVDAMLLKMDASGLKSGDAKLSEQAGKIDVVLLNASGDVVEVLKFDEKTGRMDRGTRHDLRKLIGKPNKDKAARFDRKFTADQMTLLANAMVIRFGNGELKLGDISETERGTYSATVTNQAGDIVREMELSSVTGRPIS